MSPIFLILHAATRLLRRLNEPATPDNPVGSPSNAASSPRPRPILTRPHLAVPDANSDADIGITKPEAFVLAFVMLMVLAWLVILGLDYLLPGGSIIRRFVRAMRRGWERPRYRVRLEESEGNCGWEV